MGYVCGTKIFPTTYDYSLPLERLYCFQQDHLLRNALLASLSPELAFFVSFTKSFHAIWTKLADLYAKPSRGCITEFCETLQKSTKVSQTNSHYMQNIQIQADVLALVAFL